jgi:sensor histidine kinase YesM
MELQSSRPNLQQVYKMAAIPVAAILTLLLRGSGGLGWWDAAALGFSIGMFGQLITVPSWYSCRIAPVATTPMWRLLLTHVVGAQILSFFWLITGIALSHALSYVPELHGIEARFLPRAWIIYGAGNVLYLLSIAFHYASRAQEASRDAETRAMTTSIKAREAELKALKSQINPHFLFNSLNSISALTSIDPSRAREMCILLGDFLRLTLGLGERTSIKFSEEIELLEKYMAIEKVRFGARLTMREEIQEDAKPCMLPPLLLQPLVENAVKHGIANLIDGGEIRLAAQRQNGRLAIVVENSWDPDAPPSRKGGLGLKNVQQRLDARYGKDASLRVNTESELFQVSMTLPAESEEKS